MSGRKENLLEKVLKPVRINPIMFVLGVASFSACFIDGNSEFAENARIGGLVCGAGFTASYLRNFGRYFYATKKLTRRESGFNALLGSKQMCHWCNRQAFYVASVEKGYREEAKKLIKETPNNRKMFWFIPHV